MALHVHQVHMLKHDIRIDGGFYLIFLIDIFPSPGVSSRLLS